MALSLPRFTKGISTVPPRSMLQTMPNGSQTPWQMVQGDEFAPYVAGNYTVTQTNGTATAFGFPGGVVQLATTGGTAADNIYLSSPAAVSQIIPGNGWWAYTRLAWRSLSNDTTLYSGVVDNATVASIANGIYFLKPSGGSTVNLVIKKATTTTTFQNVADLGRPSGLTSTFDPAAATGTLAGTVSGGALTAISVATPGAGYMMQPVALHTTASGTLGTAVVMLGSTALGPQSFNQNAVPSAGLPYGSLAMPYITGGGSAYTNGAASFEVDAFIDLQLYFDGKGKLSVGVNGRQVMSIGGSAVEIGPTAVTPGNTYNLTTLYTTTGCDFSTSGTQLSTSLAPFQPPIGSFYNMSPQLPMFWLTGFTNTTANPRSIFLHEYAIATETN